MNFQKRMLIYVAASLLILQPAYLQAQNRRTSTPTAPTTTSSSTVSTTSTGPTSGTGVNSYTPTYVTTTQTSAPTLGSNVQKQGEKASLMQQLGMIAGIAGAAYCGVQGARAIPNWGEVSLWAVGMGASIAVAAVMYTSMKQSDQTVADVTRPGITKASLSDYEKQIAQAQSQLNTLAKKIPNSKFDLNKGTFTINGKTGKFSDIGNKSAMSAAGFSDSEIAGMQNSFKESMKHGEKVAKKGLDSSMSDSFADGGGGGGGGGAAGPADAMTSLALSSGAGVSRDPAQVAGLSRNYNGEPIGVSSENLFALINRRYDLKAQKDFFLLQGSAAAPKK